MLVACLFKLAFEMTNQETEFEKAKAYLLTSSDVSNINL